MIEIKVYEDSDREEIIQLVLHCQNDGSRPHITVNDQPELLCIREKYIEAGGNFWTAKENGRVAGSIGFMNCGNGIAILKKFFVYEPYRGAPHHLGRRLYSALLTFAETHNIKEIVLDTPQNARRAHKFYEKAGFHKINKADLPIVYDYPYNDSDFFLLKL